MIGHSFLTLEKLPYIPTMLKYRTISISLCAWAVVGSALAVLVAVVTTLPTRAQEQAPAVPKLPSEEPAKLPETSPNPPPDGLTTSKTPPAEEPPTEAERFIDEAIKTIAKLQSVSATVEQDVEMLAQKFKITGRYLKAQNWRVYLLLVINGLPDSSGRSLQVCDGETLWEYQLVLDQSHYNKLSVKPIIERLNSPDLDVELRKQALTQMGLAGPETLLVGLRKTIKFDQKEEAVLDGRKVWKLHGTWKNRQGLVGPDSRPVNNLGPLPPYIPMDAVLYLGKEDSWPYQLTLTGRPPTELYETRRIGPDGRPIGAKGSIEKIPRSIIKLSYLEVKLNVPIKAEEFSFQAPSNAIVDDNTEAILKGLDRALEIEAQKKKTEAARKEGALLDEPIDVPPSTGESKPRN
jgi:outer membrane lipoprotein-sorting protein